MLIVLTPVITYSANALMLPGPSLWFVNIASTVTIIIDDFLLQKRIQC